MKSILMSVTASVQGWKTFTPHSSSLEVQQYSARLKGAWDDFVSKAKNSTFLFRRDYMDYHADSFRDHSLLLYDGSRIGGLLPANLDAQGTLVSHQGLTYGGLVLGREATLTQVIAAFHAILVYLHKNEIRTLRYKRIPAYYSLSPTDDVAYCLFLLDARLVSRECSLVVPLQERLPFQKRRKRQLKKAIRANLSLRQETDFRPFWQNVLIPRLRSKYHVNPVHTIGEISLLAGRFPENIKQFSAYDGNEIVAGMTIYEMPGVAHAQYIAATDKGRRMGALDRLVAWLLNEHYRDKLFFDFGASNEEHGRALNHGLLEWKEGFGARCCSLDCHEIATANYVKLEPLLAAAHLSPYGNGERVPSIAPALVGL